MPKLLVATSNEGKFGQYREQLKGLPLELVSLSDLGLHSIEETGKSFEDNAILKAQTYFQQSGLPCVADDGGLEIDYLNGEPGIYSRRWKTGDENVTDKELIDYTIDKMLGIPWEKRTARFRMVMAFIDSQGAVHLAKDSTEGYIPFEASRISQKGVPFDAVLYIPRFNKIRSELTEVEHAQISQRVLALTKLKPEIKKNFGL